MIVIQHAPRLSCGYSRRDGTYWYSNAGGAKHAFRGRERFRYALRNESGEALTTADIDALIDDIDKDYSLN